MALPKQAQEQIEEANRIMESIHGTPEPEPEPELRVVEDPSVEDKPVEDEPTVVIEDAPPVEARKDVPPTDDWEQRYKVLQGKYDAEVPRLQRQLQDMSSELGNVQSVLADIQAAPEPVTEYTTATALVTADEIEEYGSEFIDVVGRRAKEVYDPVLNELKAEVAGLKRQLGGVSQQVVASDRDKMLDQLGAAVEDWERVNVEPAFLTWLDQNDPYSGDQRGKLLRTAYQRNDTERVIAFFNGFKNEHAAVAPEPAIDSTATPAAGTPTVDLNEQVAPGRAQRTPSTPASTQEPARMWTRAQIAEFYKDVGNGKFKNDPTTKNAVERDIFAAQASGRIQ